MSYCIRQRNKIHNHVSRKMTWQWARLITCELPEHGIILPASFTNGSSYYMAICWAVLVSEKGQYILHVSTILGRCFTPNCWYTSCTHRNPTGMDFLWMLGFGIDFLQIRAWWHYQIDRKKDECLCGDCSPFSQCRIQCTELWRSYLGHFWKCLKTKNVMWRALTCMHMLTHTSSMNMFACMHFLCVLIGFKR